MCARCPAAPAPRPVTPLIWVSLPVPPLAPRPTAAPHFDQDREEFKANFEKLRFIKDGAAKEFIIGVKVGKRAEVVGKTVSAAGLRGIPGLYVLSVDKSDGTSVEASDYLYKIQPVGLRARYHVYILGAALQAVPGPSVSQFWSLPHRSCSEHVRVPGCGVGWCLRIL